MNLKLLEYSRPLRQSVSHLDTRLLDSLTPVILKYLLKKASYGIIGKYNYALKQLKVRNEVAHLN